MIDLDAYFARIGYTGPRTPTIGTLRAVHALHPAAIPFENVDPLLGRPVLLDVESLQRKMVVSRRGGYCFEHNTLLKAVLERIGFAVAGLIARVLWMVPADQPPNARSHMLLKVDLEDGAYLADVGFGGRLLAAPLKLTEDVEQTIGADKLRLVGGEDTLTLQTHIASVWQDVYRFTLEPQLPIDVEVANWFTSTHPSSRFRNNLVMRRLTPQTYFSLFNRHLIRRHSEGRVDEMVLDSADKLSESFSADFDVELSADAKTVFSRLPSP
jgi:N-hydroxyarylamine O-acetyltransferase